MNWNIENAIQKMNEYTERMKLYWKLWYDSPYPSLDKLTKWIIPWKVITVWAYSNVGKSKFAYNYVNTFIQNWLKVLFFSLEVDSWMVLLNLLCNKNKISFSDAEKWIDCNYAEYDNLMIYDDIYNMEKIEEITIQEKPDIIFIDFVQNIISKWSSEYEKMWNIARWIQKLAITTNTAVISLSQLSNSVWKEVSMGKMDFVSLKWAWEFFASSDVIFILRRDDEWIVLKIQKNKYWPAWSEHLFKVDFGKSIFEYNREYSF